MNNSIIKTVTKSGCMGEWVLKFEYNNGIVHKVAFANRAHMERAIEVIKDIMSQHNTVIEIREENCDTK